MRGTFSLIDGGLALAIKAQAKEVADRGGRIVFAAIVGFFAISAEAWAQYDYTTVMVPSAHDTVPIGINGSGTEIVGYFNHGTAQSAFLYSEGVYTTFDAPSAISTIFS